MQKNQNNHEGRHAHISDYVNDKENWHIFNDLSYKIRDDEIVKAVSTLKNGKACGIDLITNKMLKASSSLLLPALNKLLNMILVSGHYPSVWSSSC